MRDPLDVRSGHRHRSWLAAATYAVSSALIGSVFVAFAYFADSAGSWAVEDRRLYGFFFTYALAVAGGFVIQTVFAGLLRTVTQLLRVDGVHHWVALGAIGGVVLPWSVARLGYLVDGVYFPSELQRLKAILMFQLQGPMMYVVQPLWIQVGVGAASGGAFRVLARMLFQAPVLAKEVRTGRQP